MNDVLLYQNEYRPVEDSEPNTSAGDEVSVNPQPVVLRVTDRLEASDKHLNQSDQQSDEASPTRLGREPTGRDWSRESSPSCDCHIVC